MLLFEKPVVYCNTSLSRLISGPDTLNAGAAVAVHQMNCLNGPVPSKPVTIGPVLSRGMAMVSFPSLSPQAEGFDDCTVPIDVLALHVVEQPAPFTYEHQQAPS